MARRRCGSGFCTLRRRWRVAEETPLEILMSEFVTPEQAATIETEAAKIQALPAVKTLGELRTPVYGNDPNELIKWRWLYRGAIVLLCGPTGIGKSAILIQKAIYWSVGRALFGLEPGEVYQRSGMRILIVQAENDEGDLAEMRDGVLAGCTDLTPEEKLRARDNIKTVTVNDKSAEAFAELLDALLSQEGPFDIVMVDPAFAYLGGDSNSQKDVSRFMREMLNPLVQRHRVGLILAHHTNKPLRGKEKDNWEAGDYAYLGAGSAEWINPARAALAIRSLGSESVFELRAAKRGKRLRWMDDEGRPTNARYIAHHGDPGVICWRDATAEEIESVLSENKGGRPRKCELVEVLHCIKAQEQRNQAYYKAVASRALGCSERAVQEAIRGCVSAGYVRFSEDGREKVYRLTAKGEKTAAGRPSCVDWNEHRTETPA